MLFQALIQELHRFEDKLLVLTPLKSEWKPQAHNDITSIRCLYISCVHNFYFNLCLYLVVYAIFVQNLLLQ